nr:MAG TPA: ROS/MUCR transcriptional regulator protein [Caudoviricetes sp.]
MQVGDTDGYGRYGLIDEDDGGLLCHECGKRYRHLSTHIAMGHKMRVADYRRAHGLHAKRPLAARSVRENMRSSWEKHAETHLSDLEKHRTPLKAVEASRESSRNRSPGAKAGRAAVLRSRHGRPLTQTEIDALDKTGSIPEWCQVAHKIMEDSTVSLQSLSESVGLKKTTVNQRMRKYRPRDWESRGSGNYIKAPIDP